MFLQILYILTGNKINLTVPFRVQNLKLSKLLSLKGCELKILINKCQLSIIN